MKNITLSIDEATLAAGREYARLHHTTLNNLVRDLLKQHTMGDRCAAVQEMFRLMDKAPGNSKGWKWKREELYER